MNDKTAMAAAAKVVNAFLHAPDQTTSLTPPERLQAYVADALTKYAQEHSDRADSLQADADAERQVGEVVARERNAARVELGALKERIRALVDDPDWATIERVPLEEVRARLEKP